MEDGVRGLRTIPYQRPNQRWICGHQADGRPCRIGPDTRGQCLATSECRPLKRGDRWECTRPAAAGGSCPDGPGPSGNCACPIERCVPTRSLGARRSLAIRWTLLLTVAVLAIGFSTTSRHAFLLPGGMSPGHAILASQGELGCATCHGAVFATSASGAATGPMPRSNSDSDRCVVCHTTAVDGRFTRQPHTTRPEDLVPATSRRQGAASGRRSWDIALAAIAPLGAAPGAIACATCHQEHRGATRPLTAMSDGSCQSCHTAPFSSFADGHPEFSRRASAAAVSFDHAAHRATHFGATAFACAGCHTADAGGQRMATVRFESACANCHQPGNADHHGTQIRAARLLALQLPEIPMEGPTAWPAEAAVGESLTPLIRLLLAGEPDGPGLAAAMALYQDEDAAGVPFDWIASAEQKAALAHAIETIVREVAEDNGQALDARLARALSTTPGDVTVTRVTEQLASARLAALLFQRQWLAGTDPAANRGGADDDVLRPSARGWTLDAAVSAAVYRPASHADPLLRALADALAAHADGLATDRTAPDAAAFRREARTRVFEDLTSRQTGGPLFAACLRCHQVERSAGAFRIRWESSAATAPLARLTRFDHASHPEGQAACESCHVLGGRVAGSDASAMAAPLDAAAAAPVMGIQPVQKSHCVTCHAPARAPSGCLTCHQYHAAAAPHPSGSAVNGRAGSRDAMSPRER